MKWEKHGLIFRPDTRLEWQRSHAALPTRLHLGGSDYRIYFTSRDRDNRTYVGYFETDLKNPATVTHTTRNPILSPGSWGYFDDHGVQACSIVAADNGDLYLYYLGWNPGLKQPLFYTAIGLAISKDGGHTFNKYSPAPIMQRSEYDPWMVSGGTVVRKGKDWIMYYLSGFKFEFNEQGASSYYDIKIAYSKDGISWERNGDIALNLMEDETNISRLSILQDRNLYRAWFPVKRKTTGYRCGYAESTDGIKWARKNEENIGVSESGWDAEAIDKMEVIKFENQYFMFYNGNRFGYEGIGLAVGYE